MICLFELHNFASWTADSASWTGQNCWPDVLIQTQLAATRLQLKADTKKHRHW